MGEEDTLITVALDPADGDWIRSLLSLGAEVVWATSWEAVANVELAPLLRLPELPVACATPPRPREAAHSWKRRCLESRYPSTPVCWVDDAAGEGLLRCGAGSAVVSVDPTAGLGDRERGAVDSWVGARLR